MKQHSIHAYVDMMLHMRMKASTGRKQIGKRQEHQLISTEDLSWYV